MGVNFKKISEYIVPSDTPIVTLTGISQDYDDLFMVITAKNNSNENSFYVRPNSSTSAVYNSKSLTAYTGSAPSSGNPTGDTRFDTYSIQQSTANSFAPNFLYWKNYSSTSVNKVAVVQGSTAQAGGNQMALWVFNWESTNAITSMKFSTQGENTVGITTNSVFTLYGIKID
jgi:hypothetical protein